MAGIQAGGGGTAGRLGIEIMADVARLQQDMDRIRRLVKDSSSDIAKSAKYANDNLGNIANGSARAEAGMNRTSASGRMMAQQMSQVAQQVMAGGNAIQALSIQLPDIVSQLNASGKAAGGFLAVMGSPWGIVLTSAISLAASMGFEMLKGEDAAKKNKRAHEDLADQLDLTKHSYNEAMEAMRAYNGEQEKSRRLAIETAAAEATKAAKLIETALATRKALQAELERNQEYLRNAPIFSGGPGAGGVAQAQAARNEAEMSRRLADNTRELKDLATGAWNSVRKIGDEMGKIASDPRYAIELRYSKAVRDLDVMKLGLRGYADEVARLGRQQQADLEKLNKEQREGNRLIKERLDMERFTMPVSGAAISGRFGEQRTGRKHAGVDLAVPVGTPVRAPNAGIVVYSGTLPGYGNVIYVDHGAGTISRLAHLSKLGVAKGDVVGQGDLLGLSGGARGAPGAGNSRGPHLHYEVLLNGKHVDPLKGMFPLDPRKIAEAGDKAREALAEEMQKLQDTIAHDAEWALSQFGVDFDKAMKAQQESDLQKTQAEMNGPRDEEIARLNEFYEGLQRIRDLTPQINLGDVFGDFGHALLGVKKSLDDMTQAQAEYVYQLEKAKELKDDKERSEAIARLETAHTNARLKGTVGLIGATKRLFAEQSAGYKIMEAAEKALMIVQLARTAISVAAGAGKIFASLGPFAFPVVAAMIAVMASLGFKGGGNASAPSIPSAEELQERAGTGSVLGDASAKSNSIANSLEIVAKNTNKDLEYSNAMLKSLRSIDTSIAAMAGTVARQISVAGGMFDTSGANLGSSGSGGFLGMFGSSTTRELWDLGLDLAANTVGNIIANGITGNTYQIVQQIKKSSGFLGIGGGTKTTYQTTTGAIDPSITSAIQDVMASLRQGLLSAADVVGFEGAEAIIDGFQVSLGKISFKDMTGQEIEDQLNAIFSKVGDDLAGAILPQLAGMQQIGEGLFETFMRVSRQYQVVDVALRSIGKTFSLVGVASLEARDRLVQLFGSLDDFVSATDYYRENFLTDAEQIAPLRASVTAGLSALGLGSVATIAQFKNVVNGLDLTTVAGQDTYAALMALAPAFYQVEQYEAQLDKTRADLANARSKLEIDLLKAQGKAAEATAKQRQMELAAMDASLRALQQQVWQAQDIAAAKDALSSAYKRESGELQSTIERFQGFADTLKDFRATLYAGAGGLETYRTAMIKLMEVGGLAAGGSGDAMGQFAGVAGTFLDAAKGRAGSLQQYQRDVAMVARLTDQAIGGANGQASMAQRQLDQMKTQVGLLIDIDDGVQTVAEAIAALTALGAPTVQPLPPAQRPQTQEERRAERDAEHAARRAERDAEREERRAMRQATEANAAAAQRLDRRIAAATRNGALLITTLPDDPINVVPAE